MMTNLLTWSLTPRLYNARCLWRLCTMMLTISRCRAFDRAIAEMMDRIARLW